ncbi:MAG: phosphomannomutase/phosphoglucomutase [Promicromonosporaceae bacterium]|nr:phosphomannomutase/phosphoglucomutase [Promicromonosporaceae bacterium]
MTVDLTQIIKAYDVRGTVPEPFSPDVAEAVGAAFARVVVIPAFAEGDCDLPATTQGSGGEPTRPAVVIGNDMRDSGPELVAAFTRGLTDAGVDVIHIGLCSTDGLYYASGSRDLPGAMFTASHNPAGYNGIKMCHPGARPVGESSGLANIRSLAQTYLADGLPTPVASPGSVRQEDLLIEYAKFLRGLVNVADIRPLKVVIDAGNGMGGHTVPVVLGTEGRLPALPLEIVPLYFELDGTFPNHEANPLDPANIVDLQKAVVEHGADLGIAFDGDADRCFFVDETGRAVTGSAVTTLVGLRELAKEQAAGRPATIIYNLICSKSVPETLNAAGARTVRTRVGHSFIKAQMAAENAVFGGEHSAHYYFRDFWFADTGMLTALHVLAALGEQEHPMSALSMMYEPYYASGEINSTVTDVAATTAKVVAAYRKAYPRVELDELDGVTLSNWDAGDGPRWWFSLRASNTEPLLRLNVEAADEDVMEKVRDDVLALVREG